MCSYYCKCYRVYAGRHASKARGRRAAMSKLQQLLQTTQAVVDFTEGRDEDDDDGGGLVLLASSSRGRLCSSASA